MKIILQLILSVASIVIATFNANAQSFEWAMKVNSSENSSGSSMVTDNEGNVYVTGSFSTETITFGEITLNKVPGGGDLFVVKYNSQGKVIWAKSIGGEGVDAGLYAHERGMDIAIDKQENIYVIGSFSSSSLKVGNFIITNSSPSNADILIVKYNKMGEVLWANSLGGPGNESGITISFDNENNLYLSGNFSGQYLAFGEDTIKTKGESDLFLAKLNNEGKTVWVKTAGGKDADVLNDMVIDPEGSSYITGYFKGETTTFDTIVVDKGNRSYNNVFIVKYDRNGKAIWAHAPQGGMESEGRGITLDPAGNVIITGYFRSSLTFKQIPLTGASLFQDIFIAKYTIDGSVVWAKSFGGFALEEAKAITSDNQGNIYVAGIFSSASVQFDNSVLENYLNSGSTDVFIVKVNMNSDVEWAKSVSGQFYEDINAITVDNNGNIYLAGVYSNTVKLDKIILENPTGKAWYFIAKINNASTSVTSENPKNNVFIFPNPAKGIFLLSGMASGEWLFTVYNLEGQIIYQYESDMFEHTVTLSDKARGTYFYTLKHTGKNVRVGKIFIE